jgi:putative adhesin
MNSSKRTVYLLLATLALAAGCGRIEHRVHDRATMTITRSWPAAGVRQLDVFEVGGRISVEAAQTSEISLVATARGELEPKKGAENDGLFESKLEGDTLRIGRREHKRRGFRISFLFDRNDVEIDYVLKVPATVSLDLSTVNGRIVTRGTEGSTEASSVNGTLDLETAGMQGLTATTVNGRVKAKFLRSFQGAKFKSVNGGVEAILPNDASFTVDLSQVNGDFEAAFPLSIHSNPGSRRVSGEVNGGQHELKIVTVNGDIELSRLNDVK